MTFCLACVRVVLAAFGLLGGHIFGGGSSLC